MPRKSSVPMPKAAVRTQTGTCRTYDDAFEAKVVLGELKETMPLKPARLQVRGSPEPDKPMESHCFGEHPGLEGGVKRKTGIGITLNTEEKLSGKPNHFNEVWAKKPPNSPKTRLLRVGGLVLGRASG